MKLSIKSTAILFVATIFFTLSSCEKELYEKKVYQNKKKNQSKNLIGSDALKIAEKLNFLLHGNSSLNQQSFRFDSPYGTIKFDEIRQVIDTLGKINYTFRVDHPESSDTKFFNLVLQEKDNYSTVKLYEYEMTQEFAQFYKQSLSLYRFTGTIATTTIETNVPCPENDFIVTVAPNPVNSGGGSELPPFGSPNVSYPSTGNIGNPYFGNITTPSSSTGSSSNSGGGTATVSIAPEDEDEWIEVSQSPRYFRLAVQNNINLNPDEPCNSQLIIGILSPIDECSKDFMNNLPNDQKVWLYNQQNNNIKLFSEIIYYISFEGSGCSEEKNNFIESIIPQIRENPTLFTSIKPFLIEKQIDDSELDDCTKTVLNAIRNSQNNDVATIIAKLDTSPTMYNTKMKQVSMYQYGLTNWSGKFMIPQNAGVYTPFDYTIGIKSNMINQGTTLQIYATMLHELIHAYFLSLIDDCIANSSGCQPLQDLPYLWNQYVNYVNGNASSATSSISQHNQIAETYINVIIEALQEFQPGLPEQLYNDLAWGGLENTIPFLNNDPITRKLTPQDRVRIEAVNIAEATNQAQVEYNSNNSGQAIATHNPQGTPCN